MRDLRRLAIPAAFTLAVACSNPGTSGNTGGVSNSSNATGDSGVVGTGGFGSMPSSSPANGTTSSSGSALKCPAGTGALDSVAPGSLVCTGLPGSEAVSAVMHLVTPTGQQVVQFPAASVDGLSWVAIPPLRLADGQPYTGSATVELMTGSGTALGEFDIQILPSTQASTAGTVLLSHIDAAKAHLAILAQSSPDLLAAVDNLERVRTIVTSAQAGAIPLATYYAADGSATPISLGPDDLAAIDAVLTTFDGSRPPGAVSEIGCLQHYLNNGAEFDLPNCVAVVYVVVGALGSPALLLGGGTYLVSMGLIGGVALPELISGVTNGVAMPSSVQMWVESLRNRLQAVGNRLANFTGAAGKALRDLLVGLDAGPIPPAQCGSETCTVGDTHCGSCKGGMWCLTDQEQCCEHYGVCSSAWTCKQCSGSGFESAWCYPGAPSNHQCTAQGTVDSCNTIDCPAGRTCCASGSNTPTCIATSTPDPSLCTTLGSNPCYPCQ